ncbi:MAG TPA: HupE/UreJ family protein [Alphaproteobacteria bacterium]|jgi:urease accessory protein
MRLLPAVFATIAALAALAAPAAAHTGHGLDGMAAGFLHPFHGFDHLLAMVSVGVWAAQQGGRATWVLPCAFVAIMALGGALGLRGGGIAGSETLIVASVLVLGAVVAAAARPPLWIAAPLVGAFALFHGLAHGSELPAAANAAAYAAGFVAATALLQGAGLTLALALRRGGLGHALRFAGGVQIGAGTLLLLSAM